MSKRQIVGRVKTYEAIVKGENIPKPGIPESFKVLIKEMQALGLDIKVLSENDEEIQIKETSELDDDIPGIEGIMDIETELESDDKLFHEGFSEENFDEEDSEEEFDEEPADFRFHDELKDE